MPEIECKDLSFGYFLKNGGEIPVFTHLNVKFSSGKFNVLLGESGCGKSTLLNIISGIESRYDGELLIDGVDARTLSIRRREMSYMRQNPVYYDKMTVFDNIAFPLRFTDIPPEEKMIRVRNIAKRLSIAHCLSRKPKNLSIGQIQRMELAKVLVKDPKIILLDEVTTSNDPLVKEELFDIIKEAKEELGATIVMVTHDYREAIRYGEMLYVLKDGEVATSGTPKELRESKDEYLVALKAASIFEEKE